MNEDTGPMMSHEQFVEEWEKREHRVRKEIYDVRRELDERLKVSKERLAQFDKTVHEQQRVILRIREIPLVGKYIVKWAENG